MEFEQLNMAVERDKKDYIVHLKIRFDFELYHFLMHVMHNTSLEQNSEYDLTRLLLEEWTKDFSVKLTEGKKKRDLEERASNLGDKMSKAETDWRKKTP